ncbi:MAG TPA: family 43 glycosylhydrolase, partial [Pyrinomonadaceae bacterium]|nr:family 43 glycosylhydrolase [Pyrinomonadaceae bacterium]
PRRLLGPWEKNPNNPIMRGNDNWKCPGHGTVVTDTRGRDWMLYHAMHAKDFVYVGRQALLDQVEWGADGWPTINGGRGPSASARSPFGARENEAEYRFFDDFTRPRLQHGWQWPHAFVPSVRVDPRRQGWLELTPNAGLKDNPVGGVVARTTTVGDYTATTVIDTAALRGNASAGLSAFGDMENALGLSYGRGQAILWRREKNDHRAVTSVEWPHGTPLHIRMTARDGHRYRFTVSRDGRAWRDVGEEVDGSYLPPWDRGVRVALIAGGEPDAVARFAFLRVEPSR